MKEPKDARTGEKCSSHMKKHAGKKGVYGKKVAMKAIQMMNKR